MTSTLIVPIKMVMMTCRAWEDTGIAPRVAVDVETTTSQRHGRTRSGHPRLSDITRKSWMAVTSTAMTLRSWCSHVHCRKWAGEDCGASSPQPFRGDGEL